MNLQRVVDKIDVPLFLRVGYNTLEERRILRSGYTTAGKRLCTRKLTRPSDRVQFNPEGSFWKDPPDYWENIVYPAYSRAHADMFEGGNVETGEPTEKVPGLVLIEGEKSDISLMFEQACRAIEERL